MLRLGEGLRYLAAKILVNWLTSHVRKRVLPREGGVFSRSALRGCGGDDDA